MKLAIMQPYLFPYLGYFQLIQAADKFVFYDDVDFIKQGWVNRNYLLLNGAKHLFTLPIQSISSNTLINQTIISEKPFRWEHKLLQTFIQAYKKAPFFKEVFPLIETVITGSANKTIAEVAKDSIESVIKYLFIKTHVISSSCIYDNNHLKNEQRVIDICIKEKAHTYINAIGGQSLYEREQFARKEINLLFLQSKQEQYQQLGPGFINGLSIIDVLMFNSTELISTEFLPNYSLI